MRNNSGEILRAVAAGETVQVTNNGVVVALLSPPDSGPLAQLAARGELTPARLPRAALAGLRRRTSARTTAQLLDDLRGPG